MSALSHSPPCLKQIDLPLGVGRGCTRGKLTAPSRCERATVRDTEGGRAGRGWCLHDVRICHACPLSRQYIVDKLIFAMDTFQMAMSGLFDQPRQDSSRVQQQVANGRRHRCIQAQTAHIGSSSGQIVARQLIGNLEVLQL